MKCFSLSINGDKQIGKKMSMLVNEKLADRKGLLEQIRSIAFNSDERIKAIEVGSSHFYIHIEIRSILESGKSS